MNEDTTFSIGQLLDISKFEDVPDTGKPLTKTEKREILMHEIYNFYKAEKDKRKKENWKRYCAWCRENRLPNTKENQAKFKRNKLYIREISFESMKYLLKHIPLVILLLQDKSFLIRGETLERGLLNGIKELSTLDF